MEQVVLAPGRIAWLLRGILTIVLCATLPQAAVASGFADVAPDSWAAPYINAIRDAGITQGCGGNNYCPAAPVTREQMAAFLIRAIAGEPPQGYCNGVAPFTDVPASGWACGHIKWLGELGVTAGCGAGGYCPGAPVTREQMAAFIVRAMEGEPAANSCAGQAPFADVGPASWACGYIKRLAALGVTKGCGNGNYCPNQPVRRDEMAAFLARAFLGVGDANPWAAPLQLLELSAADPQSLTASWLPLNDPLTPEADITYELHLSTQADFLPDAATLKVSGLGMHGTVVTNLTPGTLYQARVRALGPGPGQQNTSDARAVRLPVLAAIRTATPVTEWQHGEAVQSGPDSFQLAAGVAIPAVGDLVTNRDGEGYLKAVVDVTTTGGQTLVTTRPAGLHEAYQQLELSSAIKITPLPESNSIATGQVGAASATVRATASGARLDWPQTGFSLMAPGIPARASAQSPPGRYATGPALAAKAGQPLLSETSERTTVNGKFVRVVGPKAVAVVPGVGGSTLIKLAVHQDDETWWGDERIPIAICKVGDLDITAPKGKDGAGLATLADFAAIHVETVPDYGGGTYVATRAATQMLRIQAEADQIAADPYFVSFTAYVDEAGNGCAESPRFYLGWKEKIHFKLPV
jgi:hypothetical protein